MLWGVILFVWCVNVGRGEECDEYLVSTQAYMANYTCPADRCCRFVCGGHLASCMENTFDCVQNNTCYVDCLSDSACSYSTYHCSGDSKCFLNCSAPGSCQYFDVPSLNNKRLSTYFALGSGMSHSISFGPILAKSVALEGYTLSNHLFTSDYELQLLVWGLPSDNVTLSRLLNNIRVNVENIIRVANVSEMTDFPQVTFFKTSEYIVTGIADVDKSIEWSLRVYMDNFKVEGLRLNSAHLFKHNFTVVILLDTRYVLTFFFPLMKNAIRPYFLYLFKFPNDSFVTVDMQQFNATLIKAFVFITPTNCSFPVPFWGTYCLGDTWYSEGSLLLQLDDMIGSDTIHAGSLQINSNVSLTLDGATFKTNELKIETGQMNIRSNSTLDVTNNISLTGSTLSIVSGLNITTNTLILGDNATLLINLNDIEYEEWTKNGTFTLSTFQFNSIIGNFSTIIFQSPHGDSIGCPQALATNYSLVIGLFTCNSPGKINSIVLPVTASVVGATLLVGIGIVLFSKLKTKVAINKLAVGEDYINSKQKKNSQVLRF